jgi:hypothetical protein
MEDAFLHIINCRIVITTLKQNINVKISCHDQQGGGGKEASLRA